MSSDERSKPERIRAFVALGLPVALREEVAAWQRCALAEQPALRPVPPEALHLTLAFLGECSEAEIERAREALLGLERGRGPVELRLERHAVGRPRRSRPRVLTLPVESPTAAELQGELAGRLVSAGVFEPERRRFWPHLTVARVRGAGSGARRRSDDALPPLPDAATRRFVAVRVALYRSQLRSQGARYSSLADFDLPQKAADEVI